MFSKAFWKSAAERAVKTAAQTYIAVASVGGVFDLASISWTAIGAAAASATVLSVLSSIVSLGAGPEGSPSLVVDKAAAVDPYEPRRYS